MITTSLGANLIGNMFQATKIVGVVWDSLPDFEKQAIIDEWKLKLENRDSQTNLEVANSLLSNLTAREPFEKAWQKIDPMLREKQIGLIAEVIGNVEN